MSPKLTLGYLDDRVVNAKRGLATAEADLLAGRDEELAGAHRRQLVTNVAKACHEANRVLTAFVKDVPVQLSWEMCGLDMRESCIKGVQFAFNNPDATPEQQHEAWMKERIEQGWVFGEVKDAEKKTHPALRPYAELSEGTKLKDAVFQAIVRAFR